MYTSAMAPRRTSTGSLEAPDFSSVPHLTDNERASIRSYVALSKTGRPVSPECLIDPTDTDSIWVGGEVYANKIRRLDSLREDAVDADLKHSLRVKAQRMQQLWALRQASSSSTQAGIDDAAHFGFRSSSLWRRMRSFRDSCDRGIQAASEHDPPAPSRTDGIPAPASSAIAPRWERTNRAPALATVQTNPPAACAPAAVRSESRHTSLVPDTPDYSAMPQTSSDGIPIPVVAGDEEVRPHYDRCPPMFP